MKFAKIITIIFLHFCKSLKYLVIPFFSRYMILAELQFPIWMKKKKNAYWPFKLIMFLVTHYFTIILHCSSQFNLPFCFCIQPQILYSWQNVWFTQLQWPFCEEPGGRMETFVLFIPCGTPRQQQNQQNFEPYSYLPSFYPIKFL